MKRRTLVLIAVPLTVLVGAAAFGFATANERKAPADKPKANGERRALQEACASDRTYYGLKTQIFDEATAIRGANGARLDLLSGATVVRMTDPVLKAKSDDLGVTVCSGRFVVELPPGSESGFDGLRRLEAEIEYAAQPAADGSGLVYQLRGAEPIVYRLAAFRMSPALAAATRESPLIDTLSEPVKIEEPELDPAPVEKAEAKKPEPAKAKPSAKEETAKAVPAKKPPSKKAEKKAAAKKAEPVKKAIAKKAAAKKAAPVKKASAKKPAAKKPEAKKAAAKKPVVKKAAPPVKQAKAKPKPAPVRKASAPVRKAAATKRVAAANPCAAKRTLAERLICGSPGIATKDRRVTSLYISALDNADPETHAILRRTAGNFTAYRNGCGTEACLSIAYDDRMAEIRDIMADMR